MQRALRGWRALGLLRKQATATQQCYQHSAYSPTSSPASVFTSRLNDKDVELLCSTLFHTASSRSVFAAIHVLDAVWTGAANASKRESAGIQSATVEACFHRKETFQRWLPAMLDCALQNVTVLESSPSRRPESPIRFINSIVYLCFRHGVEPCDWSNVPRERVNAFLRWLREHFRALPLLLGSEVHLLMVVRWLLRNQFPSGDGCEANARCGNVADGPSIDIIQHCLLLFLREGLQKVATTETLRRMFNRLAASTGCSPKIRVEADALGCKITSRNTRRGEQMLWGRGDSFVARFWVMHSAKRILCGEYVTKGEALMVCSAIHALLAQEKGPGKLKSLLVVVEPFLFPSDTNSVSKCAVARRREVDKSTNRFLPVNLAHAILQSTFYGGNMPFSPQILNSVVPDFLKPPSHHRDYTNALHCSALSSWMEALSMSARFDELCGAVLEHAKLYHNQVAAVNILCSIAMDVLWRRDASPFVSASAAGATLTFYTTAPQYTTLCGVIPLHVVTEVDVLDSEVPHDPRADNWDMSYTDFYSKEVSLEGVAAETEEEEGDSQCPTSHDNDDEAALCDRKFFVYRVAVGALAQFWLQRAMEPPGTNADGERCCIVANDTASDTIVLYKPNGATPCINYRCPSPAHLLACHKTWREAATMNPNFQFGLANRIDTHTSGLMFAASTVERLHSLRRSLTVFREIPKEYIAIAKCVDETQWPLAREGCFSTDVITSSSEHHPRESELYRFSVTEYRVLEYFPATRTVLVRLFMCSGRRHQIRQHMAAAGFPLVEDYEYGERGCM